jgi:hypothetical protein
MAASNAKSAANRRNAQKSTGPRTEEGKKRSSMDAFKYGHRAETLVMPDDDQQELEERRAAWTGSLGPQGELEQRAVDEACSEFTRVTACLIAGPPRGPLSRRLQRFRYLHYRSDSFRPERTGGRGGWLALDSQNLARRTMTPISARAHSSVPARLATANGPSAVPILGCSSPISVFDSAEALECHRGLDRKKDLNRWTQSLRDGFPAAKRRDTEGPRVIGNRAGIPYVAQFSAAASASSNSSLQRQ